MKLTCHLFRLVTLVLLVSLPCGSSPAQSTTVQVSEGEFRSPPKNSRPETWFHLIGGNVDRSALTTDLEAVADVGISGIQLFHGKGRKWPGVEPQIQTLSPTWDSLIRHIADETERLDLRFTMQNCPGWAMSGGPWITPDNAMRHLISSRVNVTGGKPLAIDLPVPSPSTETWRDYQDISVLAFPTPQDDTGQWTIPSSVKSDPENVAWSDWLAGKDVTIQIPSGDSPSWLELLFEESITLRSIELPPIELLMKRRNFDPDTEITISVFVNDGWQELITHAVPRGNWQDRQPEVPYVISIPDARSKRYRMTFQNKHPMEISYLRLSTAARLHDWRGQAGYALRSMERAPNAKQSPASWVQQDAIVDVTEKMDSSGRLTWDAPVGDWTVVRFGHVNTGVTNKPAPPEATGFECDKLSASGAEQHFAGYIGRLSQPGGAADGGRLQGMLIDSWECYTQTWTPAMATEFEAKRGYSLSPWLPALAGWVVKDHASSERFLRDWRATISDLIVENYYGRLAELGNQRGLKLSFETSVGDVSPGDILQYYKSADIPMCEFWQPNDPHVGGLETKPTAPATSAAHIYGKPRIAAEAFTNAPLFWREHPFALKNVADRHFALGVNHLVFHTYTHNPLDRVPGTSFGGTIGTPFLRGQTWWKHMPHFIEYLARCGHMLQQGQPVADVLWYLGDDVDHKPRQDSAFPSGYHFDYLNADALLNRFSVDEGDLVVPEGTRWKVLWLPREQCHRMTPTSLAKIKELIIAGATVIGERPISNPTLSGGAKADDEFDALTDELWGAATAANATNGDRRFGQGRLLWGDDLEDSLVKLGIDPDVRGTLPERWYHRRIGNTEVYFVIGSPNQAIDANLHFRAKGNPEIWNPLDGSIEPVSVFQSTESGTSVPIRLPASGSTFIVFRNQDARSSLRSIELDGAVVADAADDSRVDTSLGYPAYGLPRFEALQPWVEPTPMTCEAIDGGKRMIAWKNGRYKVKTNPSDSTTIEVNKARTIALTDDWTLSFPPGWETPPTVNLDRLRPWSELSAPASQHFSGTATYRTSFLLEEIETSQRFMLDLGRVGNIAQISVNGNDAGVLWSAPFRKDITSLLKSGPNTLSIAVTNTWHNRLAYDASKPVPQRKTWTHGAPQPDSPLEFSGLGPTVQLNVGRLIELP